MAQRSVRIGLATALTAVAASVVLGACVAGKQGAAPAEHDRGIRFSHETHKDLGCTDCHTLENGHAAMPGHDICSTCHEINMDEPSEEQCAFCHTREGFEIVPREAFLDDEVKFSHQAHEAKQVECATCHIDPDKKMLPATYLKPFCMDCHGKESPALNECEVCHTEIDRETIPLHRADMRIQHDAPQIWQNVHGRESKVNPQFCALCHDNQDDCQACHQKNPPQDHTMAWKRKTHGLEASWNRQNCAACHEEDSCRKCHQETAPMSHRGSWGGITNTHCVSCHYPPEKSGCTVCHEEIEHRSALPSPHILGIYPAQCRLCHPGGVPYRAPHLMNSTVRCIVCHQ
jgi:hypothetical protein